MRKRIYLYFLGLVFVSVAILSMLLSMFFYSAYKNRVFADLRETAGLAAEMANGVATNSSSKNLADVLSFIGDKSDVLRVTVIASDGVVLFDNMYKADTLESHSDRPEFISALNTGTGEATRQSSTQMEETYYFALLLDDGTVLRVSRTVAGITGIFVSLLPVVLLVAIVILLFANTMARQLTAKLISPLEQINFDSGNIVVYDELAPYAKRINQQRQEINTQITSLQNRADTINTITNNMREGLILLDSTGKVMTANKSALAVFDVSEDSVVEADILHICRDIDFQQKVRLCLSGTYAEMSWESRGRLYSLFFSPVLSAEELIGGVVLFFDITEQRNAEQLRKEFTANVSHELKTPLTSISALSEMISTGIAKQEDIQDFSEKIAWQTKRLVSIIDDIIRISEFDEGKVDGDFSDFDLRELAVVVIDALQAQADERGVTVELFGQPLIITANRQMIDELLFNLLDNAIKYNNEGGSVKLILSSEDEFYQIAVTDNGVGIAQEHQSRVFERFYRVDKSRSKKTGGSGLGLSIVKHIASYHGGYVELVSSPRVGTTVACYIAKQL